MAPKKVIKSQAKAKATPKSAAKGKAAHAKGKAAASGKAESSSAKGAKGQGKCGKADHQPPQEKRESKGWEEIQPGKPMGKLGATVVLNKCLSLAKAGKPEALDHYRSLKSQSAKQAFALQLKVDKEASFMTATEIHSVESSKANNFVEGWLTEEQIAFELKLLNWETNESQGKKLQDFLEGLPSRPHMTPSLAAKGWKEYHYSARILDTLQQRKTDSMTIKAEGEIASRKDWDAQEGALDDLEGAMRPGGHCNIKPNKPPPPAPRELPEADQPKAEWLKETRAVQQAVNRDMSCFINLKIKGESLVNDKTSGVTPDLLKALEKAYKDLLCCNESVTRLVAEGSMAEASTFVKDKAKCPWCVKVQGIKKVYLDLADLKQRGLRIMGR